MIIMIHDTRLSIKITSKFADTAAIIMVQIADNTSI